MGPVLDPVSEARLQINLRLGGIFMPHARRKLSARYTTPGAAASFVHYTSADAAIGIIRTKRLWMRNVMCMTDYREVDHGFGLRQRWATSPGVRFRCGFRHPSR